MLAILCKPQDKNGKGGQKSPLSMTRPPSLPLHPLPYLLSHPNIHNLLMALSPSIGNGRKRANLCPLPAIRSKGKFKRSGQLY
jgi:hypothetical protein